MAQQPTTPSRKGRLFGASRPNFNDYNGPANGDYARYVDDLMAWAEQEQERQRLQSLRAHGRAGAASSTTPSADWGRSPVQSAQSAQPMQPARRAPAANTGEVAARNPLQQLARWAQKTSAQLPAQLQTALEQAQAGSTSAQSASTSHPKKSEPGMDAVHKAAPVVLMAVVGLLVILGAAHLIPIAIVAFVGYHLTRSMRRANAGKPKP